MKELKNITLCCIDCNTYGAAVTALKKSLEQITPGRTIFLTDIPIKVEGVEVIQIPSISSKRGYSLFCIKELHKYFDTDYVLLVQNDGWVICGDSWEDEFYNYDFIGAPWLYQDGRNVGNGGVSLRSKRLQNILGTDDFIKVSDPEDEIIGRLYRRYLEEKYDIKFPSEELADKFGFELRTPICKTFSFHQFFHQPFMPTVVIKRTAAMGDVVMVEPVMRYFHDKGYRVVLDTLPQFHLLFINHDFKVHRVGEVDQRLLQTAKIVNLEMAYESNPKELHLKSYFEYAGISEEEYTPYLKSPKLSVGFPLTKETKLFKKYCILHIDIRGGGRDIHGVNWDLVCLYLKNNGYDVIVLGKGEHPAVKDAIELNCTNENFLCYVAGGADLMIGIDSGISHICVSFGVPCIIFFGSVNPEYIHPDLSNIKIITNHNKEKEICNTPYCWHSVIGCNGVKCYLDESAPPCINFKTEEVIEKIKNINNE